MSASESVLESSKSSANVKKKSLAPVIFALLVVAITAIVLVRLFWQVEVVVQEQPPVIVQADSPILGTLERTITYSGTLLPQFNTTLMPKISGRITTILVREGQTVQKNQVILEIEDSIVLLQRAQAQASLDGALAQLEKAVQGARPEEIENGRALLAQAEEDLEVARVNIERTKNLYEAGTISRSRYEEAQSQFNTAQTQVDNSRRNLSLLEEGARSEDIRLAQANVDAAQKSLELAQIQVDYTRLRAPVGGTIASIMREEGDLVGPSVPVAAIISEKDIFASISIPERYYRDIAFGPEIDAQVIPLAYKDLAPFVGKITKVSPTIDARSRTFLVEIAVENDNGLLRPGMFINARIILESFADSILVPSQAVVSREGVQSVFIINRSGSASQQKARLVPVQVGISQKGMVRITDGLDGSEQVIVAGNAFLEDNQTVRVVGE